MVITFFYYLIVSIFRFLCRFNTFVKQFVCKNKGKDTVPTVLHGFKMVQKTKKKMQNGAK